MTSPFGRNDLMAIAAFRYCLGSSIYIVSDCADWLIAQWPSLAESARNVIRRDLDDAVAEDDRNRASGEDFNRLGWDCDRAQWERVRALWAGNAELARTQRLHGVAD